MLNNRDSLTDFYLLETYLLNREGKEEDARLRIEHYLLANRITIQEAEQLISKYLG